MSAWNLAGWTHSIACAHWPNVVRLAASVGVELPREEPEPWRRAAASRRVARAIEAGMGRAAITIAGRSTGTHQQAG